jgi:hypothetical protein
VSFDVDAGTEVARQRERGRVERPVEKEAEHAADGLSLCRTPAAAAGRRDGPTHSPSGNTGDGITVGSDEIVVDEQS